MIFFLCVRVILIRERCAILSDVTSNMTIYSQAKTWDGGTFVNEVNLSSHCCFFIFGWENAVATTTVTATAVNPVHTIDSNKFRSCPQSLQKLRFGHCLCVFPNCSQEKHLAPLLEQQMQRKRIVNW